MTPPRPACRSRPIQALLADLVAASMVGRMRVRWRAKTRLLPGSPQHGDYADIIAAQVIHADLHLTDLERGPLPRRARTCRDLLEAGTGGMSGCRGLRPAAEALRYH